MQLTPDDKADVARHEALLAELLQIAEHVLAENPQVELCPRQVALLERLESAFAGQNCPPGISLLSGGLAEDDYRSPAAIRYLDAVDTTPRHDWRALAPQLLRACEDALQYLEPKAFCYVLPAYLRQYLLRPDFMCTDSIFFVMSHTLWDSREKLALLTPEQRSVVQDVMNEYRWREQTINGDCDDSLLPWEYDCYRSEESDVSAHTYAGNLALEYAMRFGMVN